MEQSHNRGWLLNEFQRPDPVQELWYWSLSDMWLLKGPFLLDLRTSIVGLIFSYLNNNSDPVTKLRTSSQRRYQWALVLKWYMITIPIKATAVQEYASYIKFRLDTFCFLLQYEHSYRWARHVPTLNPAL